MLKYLDLVPSEEVEQARAGLLKAASFWCRLLAAVVLQIQRGFPLCFWVIIFAHTHAGGRSSLLTIEKKSCWMSRYLT
jgi:hypothetical protein